MQSEWTEIGERMREPNLRILNLAPFIFLPRANERRAVAEERVQQGKESRIH